MDYRVKVNYVRMGRRKMSRLFSFVKGQYVQRALANLLTNPQKGSKVIQGAIKSGIANALFQNRNINPDTLWVKEAYADGGPTLKRIRARARGSADRIIKPLAHLTVVLSDETMPEKPRRKKGVGIVTEEIAKKAAEKRARKEAKSAKVTKEAESATDAPETTSAQTPEATTTSAPAQQAEATPAAPADTSSETTERANDESKDKE